MANNSGEILIQTILVMATFSLVRLYSPEEIDVIFDLHRNNLAEYGFKLEEIQPVLKIVQDAISNFKEINNARS